MALERKDLRVYFDPEIHQALAALAEIDGIEPGKLAEQAVEEYVLRRVHAAKVVAERVDVAGLSRIRPVLAGFDRPATAKGGRSR